MDKHYDKKYEDMQVRLNELYDEIEDIKTLVEEVETDWELGNRRVSQYIYD